MKVAVVTLKNFGSYSQGRFHETEKLNNKEQPADYEKRTWRQKLHSKDGKVFIPSRQFKNCLALAAKKNGKQVPGKGKKTT